LILKQLMAGRTGKTGINSANCYQIATKLNEWDRGADSWGISPSHWTPGAADKCRAWRRRYPRVAQNGK
jgi:hypothetical protein